MSDEVEVSITSSLITLTSDLYILLTYPKIA